MKILTKDQILNAEDVKYETVDVPEWGGPVRLRTVAAKDRDAFDRALFPKPGVRNMEDFRARVVAMCVVDEDGNRVFSDADIPMLSQKSAAAIDRLIPVAQRLSGLTTADVEEFAKNLQPGPGEDSPSA
jgi:hypothetical protein